MSVNESAERLRRQRDLVFREVGTLPRALHCVRRWSRHVDQFVRGAHQRHLAAAAPEATLLAVGGYGRAELYPGSDVDLMLLVGEGVDRARFEDPLGGFLAELWDAGLIVSHAVRSPENSCALVVEDEVSATALLEARSLAGPGVTWDRLRVALNDELRQHGEPYLRGRLRQLRSRRDFYGGAASQKEPNIKESPGGLRDLQEARWVRRAIDARGGLDGIRHDLEPRELWRAWDWLARLRCLMHLAAGRRQDQLPHEVQRELAPRLGFLDRANESAAEQLMRQTLRQMRRVQEAALAAEERLLLALSSGRVRRQSLEPPFVAIGGRIHVQDDAALDVGVQHGLRAFELAQRLRQPVSTPLGQALRRRAGEWGEDFRTAPVNGERFRGLFRGRGNVGETLSDLHRFGVLAAYLPEFADTDALVRDDPYHRWSVDEHLIRAVQEVDRLENEPGDPAKREVLNRLARPDLLKMALLFHDIGKTGRGNHVERGVAMLPDLSTRIGLPIEDARRVRWLVEEHLMLIHAQRGDDLADPEVLRALCDRIDNLENLRALYLLTVCDSRATSATALPAWQDSLLAESFERLQLAMTGQRRLPLVRSERPFADLEARDPEAATRVREHRDAMPRRYGLDVEPWRMTTHAELACSLEGSTSLAVHCSRRGEAVEVWFAARDRVGLFTHLTAVLTANQLGVVSADLYTRRDGVALDRFLAVPLLGADPADERRWRRIREDFTDLSRGTREAGELVRARRIYGTRFDPTEPLELRFDTRVSAHATVLELEARDQPELLFRVASAVQEAGLELVLARIATLGERVHDRFYLRAAHGKIGFEDEQRLLRLLRPALS